MAEQTKARMLYFCATPGCSEAGRGFTDEPTFCSICLHDLTGAMDTTGFFKTDEELRSPVSKEGQG